ncbi:MAG: nucleotidyltransferase domain-containing protein [Archaeoglobaceae archaeon]
MGRVEYFRNYRNHLREMIELISAHLKDFEVYAFGSIVRGDYSVGLSDIDVAIVSDEFKDRDLRLRVYDLLLEKYFASPFEFHLLTKEKWEFFLRFVGKDFERFK